LSQAAPLAALVAALLSQRADSQQAMLDGFFANTLWLDWRATKHGAGSG